MGVLNFIFPKHCVVCKKLGEYVCTGCFANLSFDAKPLCLICNKPTFNNLSHPRCKNKYSIDGCFSAISFNKTTKKLIYNFKYTPYLTDLRKLLADLFLESVIQNENFNILLSKGKWTLVPIPLSKVKLRKRGYNQSEKLAKELSIKLNFPIKNLLKRTRDTKTQVGLSDTDRMLNIKDAFEISNQKTKIEYQNIFLVDDVVTTGSTLKEAANVLKRNGAKRVVGLTLARD